jgi:hypothetical protein
MLFARTINQHIDVEIPFAEYVQTLDLSGLDLIDDSSIAGQHKKKVMGRLLVPRLKGNLEVFVATKGLNP